jgi:CheY-like chemotaxis protein
MPAITAGRHRIEVDSPAGGIVLTGDANRISQVVTNLLTNAARYSEPGGSISVTVGMEAGGAFVRVSDQGHGIAPAELDSIFHMFVQGRHARGAGRGGLGIGLALARRLAEMHGGSLEGASEGEGKGSQFVLRLPAVSPATDTTAQPGRRPMRTAHPRRVLIVDDNVDAARTLGLMLESLGHRTRVAFDGANALKLAEEFAPEVVLLDLGMPGIDGFEVARRLRRTADPALHIIAVTGWGQDADRQRSRAAGFDLHLVKPVDAGLLAQALETRAH